MQLICLDYFEFFFSLRIKADKHLLLQLVAKSYKRPLLSFDTSEKSSGSRTPVLGIA